MRKKKTFTEIYDQDDELTTIELEVEGVVIGGTQPPPNPEKAKTNYIYDAYLAAIEAGENIKKRNVSKVK